MRNAVRLKVLVMMLLGLVLSMSVGFTNGLPGARSQAQTSSASVSQPQAIPASPDSTATPTGTPDADAGLRAACTQTLNELLAARQLIAAQDKYAEKQTQLQSMSDQIAEGLKNLRTLDAAEKQSLRNAIDAANREITALKDEVKILKKQRMTFWKKTKYFIIGGAAGIIIGGLLLK